MRTLQNYSPSALDIFWLISESPRGEMKSDIWHGRANVQELSQILWDNSGLAEEKWLTDILDYESKPCYLGGAGRIQKDNDYIVPVMDPQDFRDERFLVDGRPYRLPKWKKN